MSAYLSSWGRLVAEAIANGATCVDCGTDRNLEGDHELTVSKGGLSTRANLAIRCRKHNRAKGSRVTRYQLRIPWPAVTISRGNLGRGGGEQSDFRADPAPLPEVLR
jgi:5-methylcytosine-specific restriction endonuclease McrA